MMEPDFRTLLLADTGIAGLSGGRISWGARPQGDGLPAIVLHLISDVVNYSLDGDPLQRQSRVQVDCYASTFAAARELSAACSGLLSGYRGTSGTTRFYGIFQDSEQDLSEDAAQEGVRVFRMSLDVIAYHQQTS